jgi:NNP family nitrate/nitrite transporter-like MFS transporter
VTTVENIAPPRGWLAPFLATLAAMLALQMSNLGFSPLLPSLQKDLGMTFSQLGLFAGMYGLLAMVLSVPAGLTAKRFGEKRALVGGLVIVAVGLVLLSRSASFGEALAWRGLWITGYRFAFVCVFVAVSLTCPPSLKGRTMGVVGATASLASVIGAPFGGSLEREFGWRLAVLGYAAAALVGAVMVAMFYRARGSMDGIPQGPHAIDTGPSAPGRSAFRTPIVWVLALMLGLGGVGQFSVTFFVPSVARGVFGLDAVGAGLIISTGYLCAIVANLGIGWLMDRYNKWKILASLFVVLAIASASLSIEHLTVFRVATAIVLAGGFTAANQLYGIAGDIMRGRETGPVMGVVSLGAGVFGYFGPQALGALRDWTGGFAAGFYTVAGADLVTLVLILTLYRRAWNRQRADSALAVR